MEAAEEQSTTFSNKPGGFKHFRFSDDKTSDIRNYNLGFQRKMCHILRSQRNTLPDV